ncbi:hypothetical protein C6497_02430 [Candidatus Poribacteria bacterium]|nr:MAG: hypothetical protein C6497_02430 [Candidatus Poribacteria bacterium]
MDYLKKITWKHIFVVLLILHILPLWIFVYFPSQDGPSHVYNALVLKEYSDPANYKIRDLWKLNITIFPNWLSHILLLALLYVFPPLYAEKVFLTFAIGLIPIAFYYFLNAVHSGRSENYLYVWLGFPFAYNYLLYMGFYNFTLSISFFFLSFGYWWKYKDIMQVKQLCILYILLLLTYLSHIVSYGLVVLGISVAAACIWGSESLVETWRIKNRQFKDVLTQFFLTIKPFFQFLLYMIPIYFVLMQYYLKSLKQHQEGGHRGMQWIWEYFIGVKSIVYFTNWHIPVNYFLLAVLGISVLITIYYRFYRRQQMKSTDVFLLIALIYTYMFIKAPWGYGPGGWINDRIHLYILLMLAPWLVFDMHKYFRYGISACLILFALVHFGRTAYDHARISPEMAELVSGTHLIEPHTTFNVMSADGHKSEALGRVEYVTPFSHIKAFYGVYADDVVHLANYEANYDYFPVNRNNKDSVGLNYVRADYVVAWYYPETEPFNNLKPDYDIIHQTKHLKLFKRKTADQPDLDLWSKSENGNMVIRFDMQPDNGEVEQGYHIVGPKTMYQTGKYGWDTEWNPRDPLNTTNWRIHPRQASVANAKNPPLTKDGIFGIEDAAFRVDLPNGTYQITIVFQEEAGAEHEINMFVNEKPFLSKFIIPIGNQRIDKKINVEVTDGSIVLVINTSKIRIKKSTRHNHWVWSGCIIEKIDE